MINSWHQFNLTGYISGWGLTQNPLEPDNILRVTFIPIVNQNECKELYSSITDRMICAGLRDGGRGVCSGDSGMYRER